MAFTLPLRCMARLNVCSVNNKSKLGLLHMEEFKSLHRKEKNRFRKFKMHKSQWGLQIIFSSPSKVLRPVVGPWPPLFCRNHTNKWVDHLNEGGRDMKQRHDEQKRIIRMYQNLCQARNNIVKNEEDDLVADSYSILTKRRNNFFSYWVYMGLKVLGN